MEWNNLVTYDKGKLFWKVRDDVPKQWNTRLAGKQIKSPHGGYIRFECNLQRYMAHRVVWEMFNGEIPENMQIDHINNKRNDNRIENLQLVTNVQNQQRRIDGKGYTYVKNRTRPYQSKRLGHHLGYFGTACGAYMAFKTFLLGGQYANR